MALRTSIGVGLSLEGLPPPWGRGERLPVSLHCWSREQTKFLPTWKR
jgi:hypothetical protein